MLTVSRMFTAPVTKQRGHTLLGFCTPPDGRFRTSFWFDSSKVGEAGFRAVRKLKATYTSESASVDNRFHSLENQLHSKGVQSQSCVITFSHGPVSQHLAMTLTSPAMAAPISGRGSSVSKDSWLTAPCSRQQ